MRHTMCVIPGDFQICKFLFLRRRVPAAGSADLGAVAGAGAQCAAHDCQPEGARSVRKAALLMCSDRTKGAFTDPRSAVLRAQLLRPGKAIRAYLAGVGTRLLTWQTQTLTGLPRCAELQHHPAVPSGEPGDDHERAAGAGRPHQASPGLLSRDTLQHAHGLRPGPHLHFLVVCHRPTLRRDLQPGRPAMDC